VKPVDPDRLQEHVGRRVAELRAEIGLTQEQLAERAEVTTRYVQSIEGGHENLGLATIAKLATVLKVLPIKFFEPPATKKPRPGRPKKTG
jgi:transcriptional regulator with XRE-family HTH domain